MDEVKLEVTDGPFAGLPAVLTSHIGDQVRVEVSVFGRRTPVDLHVDQVRIAGTPLPRGLVAADATDAHASMREQIAAEHELLAATEAFTFLLERVDAPETGLAHEWDAYLALRDEARTRAQEHKQTALDRYERQLAALPIDEARRVVADDAAFWHPGTAAVREQRTRFPEFREPDPEQRLHAAIFGEQPDEPSVSPRERARERLERARLAAEERDYEQWRADLSSDASHAHPTRGNPARYAYARAGRHDVSLPPERSVEWAIRSKTGVGSGPIPQEALDTVDGLSLTLHRPSDLTPLGQLPNLRWLSVHSSVLVDLVTLASALRPARALRDLTIDAPVRDIAPLAQLTQVRNLRLEHTHVTDIAPLANLTQLSDLAICDGPLSDLTPLSGLRLGRLFVYGTRVSDLSPLSGMATLHVLGLVGCPVRDLTAVTTLPALHFVNLRRTPITDLGNLPERAPDVTFEGVDENTRDAAAPDSATAASTPGPDTPPAPVPDARAADLRTEFRAAPLNDHTRRSRLERAMLAGRRLDLAQEIAGSDRAVVGLLLPGGVGDVPFPANPWNIPPGADLTQALARVWAPVTAFAPRFVTAVHDRTLALALMTRDGAPALGYFTWRRDDDGSGRLVDAPDTLDRFADPARDYHLSLVVGSAPHLCDPTAVVPRLAGPVPRPVRDFWGIHHSLDGFDSIGGALDCNTLEFFDDDRWAVAAERLGGLPPDRFVHAVGNSDYDTYVLDLDMLDTAGNPTVAHWAHKEWEIGDRKQYWEWLDGTGTDLIFGP